MAAGFGLGPSGEGVVRRLLIVGEWVAGHLTSIPGTEGGGDKGTRNFTAALGAHGSSYVLGAGD